MRFTLVISVLITFLISGCGESGKEVNLDSLRQVQEDSLRRDSSDHIYCLEYLLYRDSEAEFVKDYGAEIVKYDTIWGAEGFFTTGTILRVDTNSRVELLWMNEANRTGLISATVVSESDWYGDTLAAGKWKSCAGLEIGMTLEEVEMLNGRPFTFRGFGWDYAGGLISWEDGKLGGQGISIQMAEGNGYDSLPQKEYEAILGDVPILSSDLTARKSGARVWSISVAKMQ
jgi:hypothetical protein